MSRARDFAKLASSHSSGATLGHRNMLTNGDLMIDQKGITSTQTGSGGVKPVDGWREGQSNVGQLVTDVSRVADAPSNTGFKYSIKAQVTTPETSLGASEDMSLITKIEGHDCQKLMYGTSDAKTTTLSFWVKSSIAGTFAVNIYQEDGNDAISKPYTISSANTWEYKTITYTGNTLASIVDDATCGLQIQWYISIGSNSTGGSDGDVWHHYTANKFAFGHVTNTHITTDNSTFQLTGCQFELGDIATPFEFINFEDALAKCQRYFYCPVHKGTASSYFGTGFYYSSSLMLGFIHHKVEMRANPTLTSSTGTGDFALLRAGATDSVDDFGLNSTNTLGTSIINNSDASGSAGVAGGLYIVDGTNAFLHLDAWL